MINKNEEYQVILKDVSKIYGDDKTNKVIALDNVSFKIKKGEFVVILGASGAGKSTLLNILGGMDNATSGSCLINGNDIVKYNDKQLSIYRRNEIGFVFQFYNLMSNLTTLENVLLNESISLNPLNSEEVLEMVGLKDRKKNFPSQLSGGEQQRVAIARAIVKNPTLLLCDEPTGALDSKTGGKIIKLLKEVSKKYNKIIFIVTHNEKIAKVADHILHIQDGKIIQDEINTSPTKPDDIIW